MATIQANVDFGGPARAGQSVDVYNHGTTAHAPIFGSDGVTALPNPVRVSGNGHVVFQAAAGSYDIVGPDLTRTVVLAATAAPTGTFSPLVEVVNTVATSGSAQTIPDPTTAGNASISRITLSANCTLTFPTATAGSSFTLVLVQDGTGSRLVTWPGTVKWAAATAPTLSTGAGKIDYLSFVCTDGTNWAGFVSGQDMR